MAIFDNVFGTTVTATSNAMGTSYEWVHTPQQLGAIQSDDFAQLRGLIQSAGISSPAKPSKPGKPVKLERKPVPVAPSGEPVKEERRKLAAEAKALLGYGTLSDNLTQLEIDAANKCRVAECFTKLGIEPLDRAKVDAYKAQKVREASTGYINNWTRCALNKYARPVPEFALSRAIEIKREIPDVTFEIEELVTQRIDPFLIMRYGNEVHYLDVWDEPGFEGRRTV